MSKRSCTDFYYSVNAMKLREESFIPAEAIMDSNATLLYKKVRVKQDGQKTSNNF